ncbi:uncharacterized protein LOC119980758 [Tripterygium wilfordii]|nr:uncharacterized protein LOC119980758 [Tripterygium wilfordii]
MKHLEGKHNLPKRGGSNSSSNSSAAGGAERQRMTLDSAVREAYFKGSLFDRVASLEHRLFQLCLEMESSSSSSGTSSQTFEEMLSTHQHQASKMGFSRSSLPTFANNPIINQETILNNPPNQVNRGDQRQLHVSKSEVSQAKSEEMKQGKKNPNFLKQKLKKSKPSKDEMTCKNGEKKSSSFWPHLKLLGC